MTISNIIANDEQLRELIPAVTPAYASMLRPFSLRSFFVVKRDYARQTFYYLNIETNKQKVRIKADPILSRDINPEAGDASNLHFCNSYLAGHEYQELRQIIGDPYFQVNWSGSIAQFLAEYANNLGIELVDFFLQHVSPEVVVYKNRTSQFINCFQYLREQSQDYGQASQIQQTVSLLRIARLVEELGIELLDPQSVLSGIKARVTASISQLFGCKPKIFLHYPSKYCAMSEICIEDPRNGHSYYLVPDPTVENCFKIYTKNVYWSEFESRRRIQDVADAIRFCGIEVVVVGF